MSAPDPMTPPDCDLRGYDFMPLYGNRLFNSHLYRKAIRDPRAGLAAFKLWWVAWLQCPAGSLPDDDDDLAMLADFGLDTKSWAKVRELALHGFVKCSDGRLYHPVLAQHAIEAYERRKRERERKASNRARKAGRAQDGGGSPAAVPRDNPRTSDGTDQGRSQDVPYDRTGQDRTGTGQDRESKEEGSEANASAAETAPSPRERLWRDGIAILSALTGKSPLQSRALLGRLLSQLSDDCPRLMAILHEAEVLRPVDPVAWITRAVAPAVQESPAERRIREQREAMHRLTYPEVAEPFIDHQLEPQRALQ